MGDDVEYCMLTNVVACGKCVLERVQGVWQPVLSESIKRVQPWKDVIQNVAIGIYA